MKSDMPDKICAWYEGMNGSVRRNGAWQDMEGGYPSPDREVMEYVRADRLDSAHDAQRAAEQRELEALHLYDEAVARIAKLEAFHQAVEGAYKRLLEELKSE